MNPDDFLNSLNPEVVAEADESAVKFRQSVADTFNDLLAVMDAPFVEQDGKHYVSTEILDNLIGVLSTRGLTSQMQAVLDNNQMMHGAATVYAETTTYLDVLTCLAVGEPVVPVKE